MSRKHFYSIGRIWVILFLTLSLSRVEAEIIEGMVRWDPIRCSTLCIPRLTSSLYSIPGLEALEIQGINGVGRFRWKVGVPFEYAPFLLASGNAGIPFKDVRLTVIGEVLSSDNTWVLRSSGDQTRFRLIGPVAAEPGRYMPSFSLDAHAFSPDEIQFLALAAKSKRRVRVAGLLHYPRVYPLTLVVGQMDFAR